MQRYDHIYARWYNEVLNACERADEPLRDAEDLGDAVSAVHTLVTFLPNPKRFNPPVDRIRSSGISIVGYASVIGQLLEADHRAVPHEGGTAIPASAVDDVAETITLVVAQILQSWLDAGSERDVTMEELGPAIREHVKGWSTEA